MCGITGIINPKDDKTIKAMTEAIVHRGPDEDGFYIDDNVALGMRRLSIIDLEGGHQPIHSADGNLTIVFNGEIYNYKELKKELEKAGQEFNTESDTEVILKLYELYGEKCLLRLRGMFVFAIYNKSENSVFVARDYFGIKPLYYWTGAETRNLRASPSLPGLRRDSDLQVSAPVSAFASEIKSFLALPEFKPEVNDEAVFNYLSYQYNPLEETFFKNVYKLPPGHYMKVDLKSGQSEVQKYWQFEFKGNERLKEEDTKKKIAETLKDSVAHHMIADVPVGSFLSGGIDSSIIATLMQKIRGESKIKTFTVSFGSVSEGAEAKETSEPLGTDHKEISVGSKEYFNALPEVIWHFDEPVADPSALGLYFLAREARKEVKVVLSGEGADELFGGYNIYLEPFSRSKISWIPKPVLKLVASMPFRGRNYAKRALQGLESRYIGNALIFNKEESSKLWRGKTIESFSLKDVYGQVEGQSESTKMQWVDIHTWLVGDILAKADKMTMAHSLELRVPFLDIEVARLAETLPDRFKWKGRTTKYLLREAFENILPESTRTRRKLGFPTPIRSWFTAESREVYDTILENEYVKEKFDTAGIKRIIDEHTSGKVDNSRKIYLLLALAIWYNVFINKETHNA